MSKSTRFAPHWDTSSLGLDAAPSARERSALGDHLDHCSALRGPLQSLRSGAAMVERQMTERVVTSVVLLGLLAGVLWLLV